MIIIKNKILPIGYGYSTINLFGILFTKKNNKLSDKTINHESIHTEQIKEMMVVTLIILLLTSFIFNFSLWYLLLAIPSFYIWYGIEYLIVRFFHKKQHDAYHDVSFEEEAYANEYNLDYLKNRKHFCWFRYLNPESNKRE